MIQPSLWPDDDPPTVELPWIVIPPDLACANGTPWLECLFKGPCRACIEEAAT